MPLKMTQIRYMPTTIVKRCEYHRSLINLPCSCKGLLFISSPVFKIRGPDSQYRCGTLRNSRLTVQVWHTQELPTHSIGVAHLGTPDSQYRCGTLRNSRLTVQVWHTQELSLLNNRKRQVQSFTCSDDYHARWNTPNTTEIQKLTSRLPYPRRLHNAILC